MKNIEKAKDSNSFSYYIYFILFEELSDLFGSNTNIFTKNANQRKVSFHLSENRHLWFQNSYFSFSIS